MNGQQLDKYGWAILFGLVLLGIFIGTGVGIGVSLVVC